MKGKWLRSTYFRIALWSLAMIVIAVGVTTGIALGVFSRALEQKQQVIEKQAAAELQKYMQDKYARITDLLDYTRTRNSVGTRLAGIAANPDSAYDFANIQAFLSFAQTVCSSDADVEDCVLVAENGATYSQTALQNGDVVASFDFLNDPVFADFLASGASFRFIHDDPSRYRLASDGDVISMLFAISNPARLPRRERVGLLIVNIPERAFGAAYRDFSGVMLGDLSILDARGETIYASHNNAPDVLMEAPADYPVGATGLTVRSLLPVNLMRGEKRALIGSSLIVMALVVALSLAVVCLVIYSYNRRSQALIAHMREVQSGHLDARIDVKRQDEIGVLGAALNDMTGRLDNYIRRTYQAELAARDSEIALLQSQINPHFLYNSLENLSMLAARAHNDELADLAAELGQLFRISARSRENIVPLESELRYVRLYMNIHAARFGGDLAFRVCADGAPLDCGVPKLILQPLVENAVIHGHRDLREGAFVEVSVVPAGESALAVSVRDNGAGMSEARIREVMSGAATIGLPNVEKRLTLLFGSACTLRVDSRVGEGTAVRFTLPRMTVEEMKAHVQAADR